MCGVYGTDYGDECQHVLHWRSILTRYWTMNNTASALPLLDEPVHTVTTTDHHAVVAAHLMVRCVQTCRKCAL